MSEATMTSVSSRAEVLIVEDDASLRESLVRLLREQGFGVQATAAVSSARRMVQRMAFDVAVLDLHLEDGSGLDVIEPLRVAAGAAQFVVLSGDAAPERIAEALRRGALEFLEKPLDPQRLVAVLERAAEKARLLRENATLRAIAAGDAAAVPFDRLGPAMCEIQGRVLRAAQLDVPILVHGESGTGKEFVARAVHAASPRARAPWLPVNCAAFRPELIDSELFGHEKGAFTGAIDRRIGLVEVARGGTLLLDEVAELPLDAQAALLRFLELGEYRRVGGSEILRSNVRIIAATNRDLPQSVAAGRFREDLYFRLAVVSIRVPPLRERREDVAAFVEHFLRQRGYARPFSPEVMRALQERSWPGNLRELRNVVDQLIVAGGPDVVTVRDIEGGRATPQTQGRLPDGLTLAELERTYVVQVLEKQEWNRTQAARILGINPRTLYRKIREYGLEGP